jgi:N-acyl-D-aspartate/D-glutamate deacylase
MPGWTDPRSAADYTDLVEQAVHDLAARHGVTPLDARLDLLIIGLQPGNQQLTDLFRRAAARLGTRDDPAPDG